MRIAVSHWRGRIAPLFDVAERLLIVERADDGELSRENIHLTRMTPFERVQALVRLDTGVLICGAVSGSLERTLTEAGIRVHCFTCGDLEAVIRAYHGGRLAEACFRMPGARDHGYRRRWREPGSHGEPPDG